MQNIMYVDISRHPGGACMGTPLEKIPGAKPATPHQVELINMPSIESQFPIFFEDTGFKMDRIDFACGACDTKLPMTSVYGSVSRLVAEVVDMDVVAKCDKCGAFTSSRIRVKSNRWCLWYDGSRGAWNSFKIYASNASGVKDAFKDMLTALNHRIFRG